MSRPIRVLELCSSLAAGGAERLVYDLVRSFDPARCEARVCALSVVQGNPLQSEFAQIGVPTYVLGARKMYAPGLYRALVRYIRAERIDLIHTHLTSADFVGRLVGRATGVPVISTMHNMPEDYERQAVYRYWLERSTCALAAHLVACSESIRTMYVRRWRIAEGQISTIKNGVTVDGFLDLDTGVTARDINAGPLITTVGRLMEQKAHHVLLAAARIVLNVRPDARFLIVGSGPLEQQLKNQARDLGVAGQVEFAGTRHDIAAILGQSDIFTLSSAWEGLPISAIEAMAAARPVVLTNVGGVPDLVTSGVEGLLVPPGDPVALAQALLALLSNPEARRKMGQAARVRVRRECNMSTTVAQYENLFAQVLARSPGAQRAHGIGR